MENRYFLPSLALVSMVSILGLVTYRAHNGLMRGKSDLSAKVMDFKQAQNSVKDEQTKLAAVKASATPANEFMKHWRGTLGSGRDGNAMLTDLSRFGNDNVVSVQGRKSGSAEYIWNGKPAKVQFAEGAGVSSEYYRLMNWMGDMERAWPLSRFEQISFEQKGASLHLTLKLSYPSFLADAVAK